MHKYRAFISYSHADDKIARRLHRRVEGYKPPRRLGDLRRIRPIFRDRDELDAGGHLTEKLTRAIEGSENLILLCSPDSAESPYVDAEIRAFAAAHGPENIYPVVVRGEAPAVFPPALTEAIPEPVAADLREEGDGFTDGALKLIAGLLPADFGEVKNREVARQRLRAGAYAGLSAVFAILLVVALFFGFQAVQKTRELDKSLSQTEAVVITLVEGIEDIVDQVASGAARGAIPTAIASGLLSTAEGMAERAFEQAPENKRLRKEFASLLVQLSRHFETTGDTDKARSAAERGEDMLATLAAEDAEALVTRTMAMEQRGRVALATGDLKGALQIFQSIVTLQRADLEGYPNDSGRLRNLSVSLERIGDIRFAHGDLTGALAIYEEGLEISRDLSARDPENAGWARDLAGSLSKVGNVLRAQGDRSGALKVYEAALEIVRDVAAQDPDNAGWSRNVSVMLSKIGEIRFSQGDLPGALSMYEQDLKIARDLAARDPGNASWAYDVSLSLDSIASVQVEQRDLSSALSTYEEGLRIKRNLAAQDPENTNWARALSVSLNRLGAIYEETGRIREAREAFEEDLQIALKLSSIDPSNIVWLQDVAISYMTVSRFDDERADEYYRKARDAYREIKARGAMTEQDLRALTFLEEIVPD